MKTTRLLVLFPLLGLGAWAQTVPIDLTPAAGNAGAGAATGAAGSVVAGPPPPPIPVDAPRTVAPTTPQPQAPVGAVELPPATGETAIVLEVGFGIRAVPPSRVSVPVGERVRITAPRLGDGVTYIWLKNGQAIAGAENSNTLALPSVVSTDAGAYACLFSTPTTLPQSSQTLVLGVGPTDRLLNLSTRSVVGPGGDQGLVSGFVVATSAQPKKLILRAIGPSLAIFGVANPLRAPVLRIYDANGRVYENGYVYPPVVGGPTYESDLAASLGRTGAFPLPAGARDPVVMMPFTPGAYTAQVTSGDGASGTVLLEIYEVP